MSVSEQKAPVTDPASLPWLGRKLLWLDDMKNVNRIVYGLFILCAGLASADFFYHKHTNFTVEGFPAFYGLYGFFLSTGLVLTAKLMRVFLKRPEDYYAPRDTEAEEYPLDQLDVEMIDD